MGMWMSLTKKPMKPMMRKPTEVAYAILANSVCDWVGVDR